MAQPIATITILRVFGPIPNELALLIFHELCLPDLVACYLVNYVWRGALNNDDSLRAKMFRLPKEKEHASKSIRRAWVKEAWKKVYEKVDEHETSVEEYWAHIRVNPLLSTTCFQWNGIYPGPTPGCTSVERDQPPDVVAYTFQGRIDFEKSLSTRLSRDEVQQARSMAVSMFISHPPITRAHFRAFKIGTGMAFPRFGYMDRRAVMPQGFNIKDLVGLQFTRFSNDRNVQYLARLWPDRLWRTVKAILKAAQGPDEDDVHKADTEEYTEDETEDGMGKIWRKTRKR